MGVGESEWVRVSGERGESGGDGGEGRGRVWEEE